MSGELDYGGRGRPASRAVCSAARASPVWRAAPPGPPQPPRKPRRMGVSSVSGLLTFVLLGALGDRSARLADEGVAKARPLIADKVVIIVREDDGGSIADQLERAGVIDSALWFSLLTLLDGNRGR